MGGFFNPAKRNVRPPHPPLFRPTVHHNIPTALHPARPHASVRSGPRCCGVRKGDLPESGPASKRAENEALLMLTKCPRDAAPSDAADGSTDADLPSFPWHFSQRRPHLHAAPEDP